MKTKLGTTQLTHLTRVLRFEATDGAVYEVVGHPLLPAGNYEIWVEGYNATLIKVDQLSNLRERSEHN